MHLFHKESEKKLKQQNLFIGEGRFVVERMVQAKVDILSVICSPANTEYFRSTVPGLVTEMDKLQMEQLTGFKFHKGVIALAKRPGKTGYTEYLKSCPKTKNLVILPEIRELENMGSIIRSAVAFGLDAILIGPRCCDPFSRKAIRCSMGNIFRIPIIHWEDGSGLITRLKASEFHLTGATLIRNSVRLDSYNFSNKNGIILGNEATGLDDTWNRACDAFVKIPIEQNIDSLNVGVAAGIFFYELNKQEKIRPGNN